jgi:four helix bundle protein
MEVFEISKLFPLEEKYSLVDQIRRSSRSVCANLAEAWRKRRYSAAFIAKLNDCEMNVLKLKCGWNLLRNVIISIVKRSHALITSVIRFVNGGRRR